MKALLAPLFAKLRAEAGFLVLLVVAAVGAWLYVQFQQVRADRDGAVHAAEVICAGAGAEFAPSVTVESAASGKPVTVEHARGAICQRRVTELTNFKADTILASATALADAMHDRDDKTGRDAARAATDSAAARAAAERMETADAKADKTDRVTGAWFAAVNGVAGLRSADH